MRDTFGRQISYLRFSVTERCDLRCVYCMAEDAEFLPKSMTLSLEDMERLCGAFIRLGVRKLRLTGGEPLVRRGIGGLIARLGAHVDEGRLDELTLTTNGTQLAAHAQGLADAGMRRVNVSLDTLDAQLFRRITRRGELEPVLEGIAAASQAGLKVKINTVVLKGVNETEIDRLIAWCGERGHDLTLIETMPVGDVGTYRPDQYLPLPEVRQRLERRWTLLPDDHRTGGPARYVTVGETGGRLGFITPMSHDFCGTCNRVRVTSTGKLYLCLGNDSAIDLVPFLRGHESDAALEQAIGRAVATKPLGHAFTLGTQPGVSHRMNMTGG